MPDLVRVAEVGAKAIRSGWQALGDWSIVIADAFCPSTLDGDIARARDWSAGMTGAAATFPQYSKTPAVTPLAAVDGTAAGVEHTAPAASVGSPGGVLDRDEPGFGELQELATDCIEAHQLILRAPGSGAMDAFLQAQVGRLRYPRCACEDSQDSSPGVARVRRNHAYHVAELLISELRGSYRITHLPQK